MRDYVRKVAGDFNFSQFGHDVDAPTDSEEVEESPPKQIEEPSRQQVTNQQVDETATGKATDITVVRALSLQLLEVDKARSEAYDALKKLEEEKLAFVRSFVHSSVMGDLLKEVRGSGEGVEAPVDIEGMHSQFLEVEKERCAFREALERADVIQSKQLSKLWPKLKSAEVAQDQYHACLLKAKNLAEVRFWRINEQNRFYYMKLHLRKSAKYTTRVFREWLELTETAQNETGRGLNFVFWNFE
ncbi:hypothetical protein NE237_029850 [Protea cynaroides]|uniref:Uncharacterized protein n=1 Tax=Protea cynaroides TaxID=273540 RepID=A0A9Q0GUP2_9MAGN|nr:hypothetical protein NE237_029850 [Protea cynaroides]